MSGIIDEVDLAEAAWLVKADFDRSFLYFLHDWELFDSDRQKRLEMLSSRLRSYQAKPTRQVAIPKSSLLSRPGALPVVDDWVLYTAVTASIARTIERNLVPVSQKVVFSFRWDEADPERAVKFSGSGYADFRACSLGLLDEYPFVV